MLDCSCSYSQSKALSYNMLGYFSTRTCPYICLLDVDGWYWRVLFQYFWWSEREERYQLSYRLSELVVFNKLMARGVLAVICKYKIQNTATLYNGKLDNWWNWDFFRILRQEGIIVLQSSHVTVLFQFQFNCLESAFYPKENNEVLVLEDL